MICTRVLGLYDHNGLWHQFIYKKKTKQKNTFFLLGTFSIKLL